MYPLKLSSVQKSALWGGTRLSEEYGKGTPGDAIAEAWVLSCREDGCNRIENGRFADMTLDKLPGLPRPFPLLIKLIDARDKLSVQVHPNDFYAREAGLPAGKTEMWYIVDALPGAEIIYGVMPGVSKDTLKEAAENGTLEPYLRRRPVKKGDVCFIPAGLVHAIGSGILIAEVQQNSNTTYRLYDYDRRDAQGHKRQLHVEEAIRVLDSSLPHSEAVPEVLEQTGSSEHVRLCHCPYFTVDRLRLDGKLYPWHFSEMTFCLCLEGTGEFLCNGIAYPFQKGDGYLFPEPMSDITVSGSGCELLTATPQDSAL